MSFAGRRPWELKLPVAQIGTGGYREFSGECGNRGKTIHRSGSYTGFIREDDLPQRVGRCACGLLVFMKSKDVEDDYRGADHE